MPSLSLQRQKYLGLRQGISVTTSSLTLHDGFRLGPTLTGYVTLGNPLSLLASQCLGFLICGMRQRQSHPVGSGELDICKCMERALDGG